MAREYVISYDVRLAGLCSVTAESEEDAVAKFYLLGDAELLRLANQETVEVLDDSVRIEDINEVTP